jgi:prophage tail gpP-like protein
MPDFTSRDLGGVNDVVRLRLGGDDLLIAESYDVRMSWFRQPAVFALRTGWGGTALDLIDKYPPNTPFALIVNDQVQFTGRIDAVNAEQSAGATEVTFHGRDDLAALHDSMADAERSFDNASYEELVNDLLTDAGIDEYTLIFQNDNNRTRKTGIDLSATGTGKKVFGRAASRASSKKKKAGQLKVGESRYGFAKKELDKSGLFLFAAAADASGNPVFVMTEPNTVQEPMARILRRRGQTRDQVNVISASFKNDTSKRYSEYVVFGRAGDNKNGQQPVVGRYIDNEMRGYGFSPKRKRTARIDTVQSSSEAQILAWRMRADDRRDSYNITYTVSGHTVPALNGRTVKDRAVWCVDTTIEVIDDEYGINETMWCTDVNFKRDGGGTTTILSLVSAEDWVAP